jgi:predicted nucleotidyltransferase
MEKRLNMSKIPEKPEDIFPVVTADCKAAFGEDLLSIILYGSGAGGDYQPGKSDLNFMIILTDRGIESLDRAIDMVKRWQKSRVALPLVVTPSYILDSLDAYPIEFISIKRRYRLVYGKDLLASLEFDHRHIRLQIERELRGKLLHLREGWLETEGKTRKIRELIGISLTAFISLFGALLYMKGLEIPNEKRAIISAAGEAFEFNAAVFLDCENVRRGVDHFSSEELNTLFKNYLLTVGRLCDKIDRLDVSLNK